MVGRLVEEREPLLYKKPTIYLMNFGPKEEFILIGAK